MSKPESEQIPVMERKQVNIKSLSSLCEISLMRNHLMLQNVANVPYRLIRNVLLKVKMEHLCKLEESNVLLIFEDEEAWAELLKKDFPLHVHDTYNRKRDEIVAFYADFVEKHDPAKSRDGELMRGFLRFAVRKEPTTHKYKVPSRMLYFKYQEDMLRKQELSTQRLRMRMQEMQQEKEKKQIVALDDPVYCERRTKATARAGAGERSGLFAKSFKEHQKRQLHFKSGGYDAKSRPVKRLAFGGQVGKPVSSSVIPTTCAAPALPVSAPASPPAITQATPQPKRSAPAAAASTRRKPIPEQNLFLKRRRPLPKPKVPPTSGTEPSPKKKPTVVKVSSTKIHRKTTKTSIFAAPSPQQQVLSQRSGNPSAYIFDQPRQG
ncbi:LAQU0S05e05666g1_1 [Lachancea quebecensis]|uniref:LAQU0S05e05666g1_1 n=1 Tax=Lachancea quebecensis TaxID=1654605 RepID=A0A0P1KRE4_9SACH|nr:LAQU0S05e05666g1_1 [Lachancea quebecensis]